MSAGQVSSSNVNSRSLTSFLASSSTNFTSSVSSLSTVLGLGSLSGKAILALGKATLRGAENLIIHRKLRFISSKFPHTNAERSGERNGLYRDLLELSRANLYPNDIRAKVMKIIIVQIGTRQTFHLLKALSKWPSVEIQLLVAELVSILDPIRLSSEDDGGGILSELTYAYRASIATWESHSLIPLVEFLYEVGELRESASLAVTQGGALDFLFHAYITGFRDPLRATDWLYVHPMFLRTSGNHLLSSLSANQPGLELIKNHPLYIIWPTRQQIPFTTIRFRDKNRIHVWHSCHDEITHWRLLSTFDMMKLWTFNHENVMYDMAIDLLELAGSNQVDLSLSMRALRNLHRMCMRHQHHFQRCVGQYFASSPSSHFVDIFSQIISRIYRVSSSMSPEAELFFLPSDSTSKPWTYNIITALLLVSQVDQTFLEVLIASGILALLRHLVSLEIGRLAESDITSESPNSTFDLVYLHASLSSTDLGCDLSAKELEEHATRRKALCIQFSEFLAQNEPTTNGSSIW